MLALSAYSNAPHVQGMLETGAVGYVLKEEALETIEAAVRAAARGESWLSPKVVAKVMKKALGKKEGGRRSLPSHRTGVRGFAADG